MRKPSEHLSVAVHALSRRALIVGLPLLAAGCIIGGGYGSVSDSGFLIPAVDINTLDAG